MVQKMIEKDQLPKPLHKRINVLMKRRPQKVSNRELARVTSQITKTRGLSGCKPKKTAKKTKASKANSAARKSSDSAAEAPHSR